MPICQYYFIHCNETAWYACQIRAHLSDVDRWALEREEREAAATFAQLAIVHGPRS